MKTLRQDALAVVAQPDPAAKARLARALLPDGPCGEDEPLAEPPGLPGRPEQPVLVPHTELKQRSMKTVEGRATLIHALAHIELNAIDLAADAIWRFPGMPALFYRQWAVVAQEEALHFLLLREHLQSLGYDYGSFPAHNGLWEMAEKTKHDLLARLALVPRTLEARGLDAAPPMRIKLVNAGDLRAGEILEVILRDEVGHVAVGNHWYRHVCAERGLDPVATYPLLATQYGAPRLRGPFNMEARRAAGFDEDELAALG
ncbi:ferritin-like domain-containing protein [Caenimonas sedimenti]|uniref:Ferritin-like domain-containing protein n=1 Tax=Caenimonas sedimenti TaxID=2596921 RepID=A0A562ZXS2_9BURK|nr:ferritin-like domain-containing protein [Caenimonas sedimenti]TWO73186.1 ferritin-like domain-containing protein [Caenimonas sedimenti]